MLRPFRILAVIAVLIALVGGDPTPAIAAPGDDAVLTAFDAFRTKNRAKLAAAAPGAQGHVLEPYVQYWQLTLALDEATPEAVREFIAKHPQSFLADRLRADWIRQLGRRGDWALVQREYPGLVNEDADVTCWALVARAASSDASAAAESRSFWNQPRAIPEPCAPLIDRLVATGVITSADVWQRSRMLLDQGALAPATRTLEYLPAAERPDDKLLALLAADPKRHFDRLLKLDFNRRATREMTVFALGRLARTDVEAAATLFDKPLQAKLQAEERAAVFANFGLAGARRHMPEAIGWYRQGEATVLSEEHQGWRVRAALRESDWAQVKAWIEKMASPLKNDPTWVYWLARAHRQLGESAEAQTLLATIAGQPHFYGNLAGEDLGMPFSVPPKGHAPTTEELTAIAKEPGIARALALFRLEMRSEAVREWFWTIRPMDDKRLIAAAELARQNELWDRAINTAERTVGLHDFSLRFLAPYRPQFAEHAKAQAVEEAWVLGLTRQESRFIAAARSHAGASGLMQLMPATARQVARRIGMKDFRWSNVTDPQVNIQLGTSYMREVLDGLDNHPVLASAAYNAGPSRAQRWRGSRALEGAIYVETIPFNETRDYVKRVFSNTMYYAAVLGGEARPLKARLGTIAPRAGMATTAAVAETPAR